MFEPWQINLLKAENAIKNELRNEINKKKEEVKKYRKEMKKCRNIMKKY